MDAFLAALCTDLGCQALIVDQGEWYTDHIVKGAGGTGPRKGDIQDIRSEPSALTDQLRRLIRVHRGSASASRIIEPVHPELWPFGEAEEPGMSRQAWFLIVVAVVVAGVLLSLGVIWLFPGQHQSEQTLSSATSPDGTWSVAVLARPQLSGSYDISVEVRDAQGQIVDGGFVVDNTRDLDRARKAHAVSFVDNNTAKVGTRTVDKPSSIRK